MHNCARAPDVKEEFTMETLAQARKNSCIWQDKCQEADCDECLHYCPFMDGWGKEQYEMARLLDYWNDWLEVWNDFIERMGVLEG